MDELSEIEIRWNIPLNLEGVLARSDDLSRLIWNEDWADIAVPATWHVRNDKDSVSAIVPLEEALVEVRPSCSLYTSDEALVGLRLEDADIDAWIGTFRESWRQRAYGLARRLRVRTVFGDAHTPVPDCLGDPFPVEPTRIPLTEGSRCAPIANTVVDGIRCGGLAPIQGVAHRNEERGGVTVHHHRVRYRQPWHRQNLLVVATAGSYDFDEQRGRIRALGEGIERHLCGFPSAEVVAEVPRFGLTIECEDVYGPLALSDVTNRREYVSDLSRDVFVDEALVHYPSRCRPPHGFPGANSSGVAARSTVYEASVYAERELIERHALLWYWYGRARPRLVGRGADSDAQSLALVEELRGDGYAVEFRDLALTESEFTLDENRSISVIVCLLVKHDSLCSIGLGAGSRPSALRSSLLEAFDGVIDHYQSAEVEQVETIGDHRNWYRSPRNFAQISDFLEGGDEPTALAAPLTRKTSFVLVGKSDGLSCVRAVNPSLIPLFFGASNAPVGRADVAELIHRAGVGPFPHPLS